MPNPFPTYAIGEEWPGRGGCEPQFALRLRSPVVIALLEPCHENALYLHIATGPGDIVAPPESERIMRGLARFALETETSGIDLPEGWGYSSGLKFAVPDHIWLYNTWHPWTGILRTKKPASVWAVRDKCSALHFVTWTGAQRVPDAADAARAEREIEAYAVEFVARMEASLHSMFPGAAEDCTIPKIKEGSLPKPRSGTAP